MVCDGQAQCLDWSDESVCNLYYDCSSNSIVNQFNLEVLSMPDNVCIPLILVCDKIPDCINHSDETHCI
jgi:hypothetical protein